MTIKEAKEISKEFKDSKIIFDRLHPNAKAYLIAEGYLECLENGPEILALVKAVENLSKHWSMVFPKNNVIRSGSEYLMEKVDEALARYREEVKK